jgi:hypothetical protein
LYAKPSDINEWLTADVSNFPYKLESLSWLSLPNEHYNNILEEFNGSYKWYTTGLLHERWSNNIFIGKTNYIKNNIIELIKQFKSSNNNYTGLEDVLINNKIHNMRLAGGDGLFTHKDY